MIEKLFLMIVNEFKGFWLLKPSIQTLIDHIWVVLYTFWRNQTFEEPNILDSFNTLTAVRIASMSRVKALIIENDQFRLEEF
mgnify:CR=1 FL=1